MGKLEENVRRMNVLVEEIIDISNQQVESAIGNLRYRIANHRRRMHDKNTLVSELMTIIADCRKMKLDDTDKAKLDASIRRLNKKLYLATSLTIL